MSGHRSESFPTAKTSFGLGRLRALRRLAGLAPARSEDAATPAERGGLEHLEQRILLGGDHPSFDLPLTPTSGTEIVLDGMTGEGSVDGEIEDVIPSLADDLFRFDATGDDFVTVWADTINVAGGSSLDSRVEVYDISGTLIAEGSSQGELSSGFFSDGWTGFVGEAGETYFIRVLSDISNTGMLTTGGYTIRVDATSNTDLSIETDPMAPFPLRIGEGNVIDTLSLAGDDVIYTIQTGSSSAFDSLATFYAALPEDDPLSPLDTQIEVYDSTGALIDSDSDTGRLTSAFTIVPSAPDTTFYVRVRSDEFDPTSAKSTGDYQLRAETAAATIDLDPVTRLGTLQDSIFNGGRSVAEQRIASAFDTRIFQFTTLGEGLTILESIGVGDALPLPNPFLTDVPLPEPAMRLYELTAANEADLIGFSDLAGAANLQIQLETNTTYFIVIESFDDTPPLADFHPFNIYVESNHTLIAPQDIDDHVDRPEGEDIDFELDSGFTDPEDFGIIRPLFEQATPLIFGDPVLPTRTFFDPLGFFPPVVNPVGDLEYQAFASGQGRIQDAFDTDLFQFTLPTDLLSNYPGDNDDAGDALFFGTAGDYRIKGFDENGMPITRSHLGIFDAQDYFPVRAGVDGEIRAMTVWDHDPDDELPPSLIIGGDFSFVDFQPANNLAAYTFDPLAGEYVLVPLGAGVAGTVHALSVFDVDGEDGDLPPALIIGGDFAGGITSYSVIPPILDPFTPAVAQGAFAPLAVAAPGAVFAIAEWDPEDADDGENPNSLWFGGDGGVLQSVTFDEDGVPIAGTAFGVVGEINALTVAEVPDLDPDSDGTDPALFVGGLYSDLGGLAVDNVSFVQADTEMGSMAGDFLLFDIGGANDRVRTFTVWDRDAGGDLFAPEVVAGGDFTTIGGVPGSFVGTFDPINGVWGVLGSGFDAPVHTLINYADEEFYLDQAFGNGPLSPNPAVDAPVPVLYAGGEFSFANGTVAANGMARFEFTNSALGPAFQWLPLGESRFGSRDRYVEGAGTTDTVFALQNFNDELPGFWDRDDRTAARLQLVVSGDFAPFINSHVRIYDSQFRVVWTNDTIAPPFPDPSGSVDPAAASPELDPDGLVIDIGSGQESQFWAGEVYYLEIAGTATDAPRSAGRYQFTLASETIAPDFNDDFVGDGVTGIFSETLGNSDLEREQFDLAPELILDGFGDGNNFLDFPAPPLDSAFNVRSSDVYPSGFSTVSFQDLGVIHKIDDFDIYFFRASSDGTVEVRTATQQIFDQYVELTTDLRTGDVDANVFNGKTYDSPLDTFVTIFNNDLEILASNNDNPAFAGVRNDSPIGQLDLDGGLQDDIRGRVFNELDSRVVAQIEQGEVYFVVVQSGQFDTFQSDPAMVDWAHATGSYELLINTTPNLSAIGDDHSDLPIALPGTIDLFANDTVIGLDAITGQGSITGEIRTRLGGAEDNDGFVVYATGTGNVTVTVAADSPSDFQPRVTIFDDNGLTRVTPVSATTTDPAEVTFFAQQGERFIIRVDAQLGQQGGYSVDVQGAPFVDDVADFQQRMDAQELVIQDFLGSAEFSGSLEAPGDTDIFRFSPPDFDLVSVEVESNDFGFNPAVRIYEVSEDPNGNPILLQIGFNDDANAGTLDAFAEFPVTGPDRTSTLTGETYNDYFIVVEGSDRQGDAGQYTVRVNLAPTDDHPDEGEFDVASQLFVQPATGQGSLPGTIEVPTDTDLFTFTAPAGGQAVLAAISAESSTLRPTIRVFDADFNPVINLTTGTTDTVLGPDAAFSAPAFRFDVVRGEQYFVLVGSDGTGSVTTDTGAYTLEATTPTADDHANESEFGLASEIVLSTETGAGSQTGNIATIGDTDLFFFDTIADGSTTTASHVVRLAAGSSETDVILRVFDASTSLVDTIVDNGPGDEDATPGVVQTTINVSAPEGERFFLLASIDAGSMFLTDNYVISVEGPLPDIVPSPDDDHADRGQFSIATVLPLDARTGDASGVGRIEAPADSDLFQITSLSAGQAFVQVVTPSGTELNADITVFERPIGGGEPVEIIRDTAGFQGVNAAAEFNITGAGVEYFFLVTGLNGTGEYSLRIDTEPETFFLFYPEGFANETISEFVSIANPSGTQSVTYSVRLFYENTSLAPVTLIDNEVLAPNSRGGVTIADRGFIAPGVAADEPFSIVIESDGQLGATLSHYDLGGAIGEAFTPITSDEWTFGRLERNPGQVESFLVFYNPNPDAVIVTLSTVIGGETVEISQTVEGNRRGGWELTSLGVLPVGVFGATITSEPADATGAPGSDIVAALSHYNVATGEAFGVLGDPTGGSTLNVVPSFTSGSEVQGELVLYNPASTAAAVTIVADYITAPLPDVTTVHTIAPGGALVLDAGDLSLSADLAAGLSISSSLPISGVTLETQNGDANAIAIQNQAARTWFFGDAFINSELAGLSYFETLSFFNPTAESVNVDVRLFFNDGTTSGATVTVGSEGFSNLQLDSFSPILSRQLLNFFSIQVSASVPIVTSLTHYDLILTGGWTNAGAPLGLLNPLQDIAGPATTG
ncbi:MAG: hypothetical protein AAFX79_05715 [Planctomycetota bacterium]